MMNKRRELTISWSGSTEHSHLAQLEWSERFPGERDTWVRPKECGGGSGASKTSHTKNIQYKIV